MNDHFNQLTPAQAERLAILAEECGEVIQIIGKILRHGLDSFHPATGVVNRTLLLHEIIDVKAAMVMVSMDLPEVMVDDALQESDITRAIIKKLSYAHHQGQDFKDYLETIEVIL